MTMLCLQEEEFFAEKAKSFLFCMIKGFKEKDAVQNVWEKIAKNLEFTENCNFIRASSNCKYFEDSCSEKIDACVLCPKFLQNISKPIRFSQMLYRILLD